MRRIRPPRPAPCPVQDSYAKEELLCAGRAEWLPRDEDKIDIKRILRHLPEGNPLALI